MVSVSDNRDLIERSMEDILRQNVMNVNSSRNRFLHNHPNLENRLGLRSDHVIVDRDEWQVVIRHIDGQSVMDLSSTLYKDKDKDKLYNDWCKSVKINNVLKLKDVVNLI